MREVTHSLPAAASDSSGLHNGAYHRNGRAGGYDETVYDFVLGHSVAERLLPREECQSEISVSHVLGLCETAGVGIGHGYEFRKRDNIRHDVKPLPQVAVVPALQSKTAKSRHATSNVPLQQIVNGHGYQIPNSLRASSQAANARTVLPPAVRAPIQARPS